MAGHRRLCIRGRESKGGGHAFAALTVGSRRVVNNRDVIRHKDRKRSGAMRNAEAHE